MTSKAPKSDNVRSQLPSCVPFRAGEFGLTTNCVAQCENLLSIDLAQIDLAEIDLSSGPHGTLDEMAFRNVIKAIGYVRDSDCEPV